MSDLACMVSMSGLICWSLFLYSDISMEHDIQQLSEENTDRDVFNPLETIFHESPGYALTALRTIADISEKLGDWRRLMPSTPGTIRPQG